jgi:predicted TIM-barrel fold metal-dependent hydrolase
MRRIDAHTHVFEIIAGFGARGELRGIGRGRARWANGDEINLIPAELGDKSFAGETLAALLQKNNIGRAILLQGSFYGFQNDYAWEVAQRWPQLFVPAATVDPFCKDAQAILERFLFTQKRTIIKFELSTSAGLMGYHNDFRLDGPVLADLFAAVHKADATLVLDIGSPGTNSYQPAAVAAVANRYPALRIVVCHLLAPGPGDADFLTEGLRMLALPNVWFDLAALPWNIQPEEYPYPTARRFIGIAQGIVGCEKLIWGTDTPATLTRANYPDLFRYIEEAGLFTDVELEKIFCRNAEDAYSLT